MINSVIIMSPHIPMLTQNLTEKDQNQDLKDFWFILFITETLWLSLMKEFWWRRQKKKFTYGVTIVPLKNWINSDIKHVCNCKNEVFVESLADAIRGKMIKRSAYKAKPPSQCCFTLYIQQSNKCNYGMIFRTCCNDIDQETLHSLWTTCLAKIGSIMFQLQMKNQCYQDNCWIISFLPNFIGTKDCVCIVNEKNLIRGKLKFCEFFSLISNQFCLKKQLSHG